MSDDPRARLLRIEITAQGEKIYELPVHLEQRLFDQVLELADQQDYTLDAMVRALTIQGLILRHEREKERKQKTHEKIAVDPFAPGRLRYDMRGTP